MWSFFCRSIHLHSNVPQWNKTGEGIPFKPTERDIKMQAILKDKASLEYETRWIAVKNPSTVCLVYSHCPGEHG